jgi:hypothetical protein
MRSSGMQKVISAAVGGLLSLACLGIGFASTTFDVYQYNYTADGDGGGFVAYLNGNMSDPLEVYCVDYLNGVEPGPPGTIYPVNIDTPDLGATDDGLGDTRYGTTTAFSWNSLSGSTIKSSGSEFGNAYDRYVMAGWLSTQYSSYASGSTDADGIQSAIWTLLDVNGATFTASSDGDVTYWLQQAVNFMSNTSVFNNFASDVRVYTSTDVSSDDNLNFGTTGNRYQTGYQEMIGVMSTPEPAALALVGCGLVLIGALKRRRRR